MMHTLPFTLDPFRQRNQLRVSQDRCENCGEKQLFTDDWHHGDTICTNCGICMPERLIDCEHEGKRNFSADSTSVGMKQDKSSTMKTDKFLGFQGTKIKMPSQSVQRSTMSEELTSLNQLQNRSMDNKSKRLQAGLMEISDLCAALRLSDTIKRIASEKWANFEKARKKHSRGGDKFMYAALIYMASKESGHPRTFDEISSYTGLDKKEIVKCYKRLVKEVQRDSPVPSPTVVSKKQKSSGTSLESTKSRIDRISQVLGLDYPVSVKAKSMVEHYTKLLEGKKPDTIAAVCITKALTTESISQKTIADAARVSSNTLRSALEQVATLPTM